MWCRAIASPRRLPEARYRVSAWSWWASAAGASPLTEAICPNRSERGTLRLGHRVRRQPLPLARERLGPLLQPVARSCRVRRPLQSQLIRRARAAWMHSTNADCEHTALVRDDRGGLGVTLPCVNGWSRLPAWPCNGEREIRVVLLQEDADGLAGYKSDPIGMRAAAGPSVDRPVRLYLTHVAVGLNQPQQCAAHERKAREIRSRRRIQPMQVPQPKRRDDRHSVGGSRRSIRTTDNGRTSRGAAQVSVRVISEIKREHATSNRFARSKMRVSRARCDKD